MHSTIILTHGWTGSSVFAALLGRAGAWLGSETVVKSDYDTHENSALVDINRDLMRRFGADVDHEHHFDLDDVLRIYDRSRGANLDTLRRFVGACDSHAPWAWKDPRLTWTMRIWHEVVNRDDLRFLVLVRDPTQAWITSNLRRHIQSASFTKAYNDGITRANLQFLQERRLPHLVCCFEDLLMAPSETLSRMNELLDCNLGMADLQSVCRLPLGRPSRGFGDWMKASAIYLKNYSERDGRRRRWA